MTNLYLDLRGKLGKSTDPKTGLNSHSDGSKNSSDGYCDSKFGNSSSNMTILGGNQVMRKKKAQKARHDVEGAKKRMHYECFQTWKGLPT